MAQAQAGWLFWLQAMSAWAVLGAEAAGPDCKDDLGRVTPRLTTAEAIERAKAMADRFNRIFLRTLRALCDLRRRPLAVVVQRAGQVNVGDKQFNVTPAPQRGIGEEG